MSGWHLDFFECLAGDGETGPSVCKIGGWVNDPFGIDRRRYFDPVTDECQSGWIITHLPTGYSAMGVVGSRRLAQEVVGELLTISDWDFVDVVAVKTVAPAVREIMNRRPEVRNPAHFDVALWLEGGKG